MAGRIGGGRRNLPPTEEWTTTMPKWPPCSPPQQRTKLLANNLPPWSMRLPRKCWIPHEHHQIINGRDRIGTRSNCYRNRSLRFNFMIIRRMELRRSSMKRSMIMINRMWNNQWQQQHPLLNQNQLHPQHPHQHPQQKKKTRTTPTIRTTSSTSRRSWNKPRRRPIWTRWAINSWSWCPMRFNIRNC